MKGTSDIDFWWRFLENSTYRDVGTLDFRTAESKNNSALSGQASRFLGGGHYYSHAAFSQKNCFLHKFSTF